MALKTLTFSIPSKSIENFAFELFSSLPKGWERSEENEATRRIGECIIYCCSAQFPGNARGEIWVVENGIDRIKVEFDDEFTAAYAGLCQDNESDFNQRVNRLAEKYNGQVSSGPDYSRLIEAIGDESASLLLDFFSSCLDSKCKLNSMRSLSKLIEKNPAVSNWIVFIASMCGKEDSLSVEDFHQDLLEHALDRQDAKMLAELYGVCMDLLSRAHSVTHE